MTIRSGFSGTVVVPNLCSTVAGNAAVRRGRRARLLGGLVGAAAGQHEEQDQDQAPQS